MTPADTISQRKHDGATRRDTMHRPYRPKQFVRVVSGNLEGMTGTVHGYRDDGRVAVRLTSWGRLVAFEQARLVSEDREYRQRIEQEQRAA